MFNSIRSIFTVNICACPNIIVMKKKMLAIIALFFAVIQSANCQQFTNTLKLETGCFIIPGSYNPQPYSLSLQEQHGLYYEHTISRKIQISFGMNWWNSSMIGGYTIWEIPQVTSTKYDSKEIITLTRTNYKMVDIAVRYSLIATKRHRLNAGLGISFANGSDIFYKDIINYPLPPDVYSCRSPPNSYEHSDIHLGAISSLSYDCYILKGRFAVGVDIKCRKYFSLQSVQLDYGIHVGYNFK